MAKAAKKQQESVHVIAGENEPLVNEECLRTVAGLLEPQERGTCLLDVDGDKAVLTEVLDELRTLPFLAKRRVALVRRADKFVSDNRELLEAYFDSPSATGVLILAVKGWASNTRLAKKLPAIGRLTEVEQPKAGQLPGMMAAYVREKHGKTIERAAAELVVELVGDDLLAVHNEADKLAVYVGDAKTITAKDVEALTGEDRLFGAFEVIDACLVGDVGKATSRMRRMFAADKDAEYRVVGAFAYHFRKMWNAKKMLDEGDSRDWVARKAGIWYNRDAYFEQLKNVTLRQIGDYLERLAEIDYEVKTGRTRTQVAIERLVAGMCL